ncbi:MAG: hypothetical protein WAM79_23435, partial [Candidatus Sulfotelmatobacter sp.]
AVNPVDTPYLTRLCLTNDLLLDRRNDVLLLLDAGVGIGASAKFFPSHPASGWVLFSSAFLSWARVGRLSKKSSAD